jgi:hypothetical protein
LYDRFAAVKDGDATDGTPIVAIKGNDGGETARNQQVCPILHFTQDTQ